MGVAIAVIDTGIDADSPEFAGRISSASQDVAGSRGYDDADGHGTQVALVAAGGRNNSGIMGIAFDATVVALRADEPGSCDTPDSDCQFNDSAVARGIDAAIGAGAKVINLSLGGEAPTQEVVDAVARAGAAGLVIVVAAGNNGDGSAANIDPANPDPFGSGILGGAPENVIIVGSVDENNVISDFSNRAGTGAGSYLTARGEDVCCQYRDGEIYVATTGGVQYLYVMNGTSFSAPQVSGAVALLAQAFPNLTGAEIVDIILGSARDLGVAGTDAIYGHGMLDIKRAFAPQGTTTLAGTSTPVALGEGTGVLSPAMGDAARRAMLGTVVLDGYDRAYGYDMAANLGSARLEPRLYGTVGGRTTGLAMEQGATSLAFTIAPGTVDAGGPVPLRLDMVDVERSRLLAVRIGARIAPDTQFAFALREGASGLEASMADQARPAFLVAGEAVGELGFMARRDGALAIRQGFTGLGGEIGLTGAAEMGEAWSDAFEDGVRGQERHGSFARYGATLDWQRSALALSLGLSWLNEAETILGARFGQSLGTGGADTLFVDAATKWQPAVGWTFSADYRRGFTRPEASGMIAGDTAFQTSAWSFDVERGSVFARGDGLGFRVSQPLRVESGAIGLNLPVGYSYATGQTTFDRRDIALTPSGREVASELRWYGPMLGGSLTASLFYRVDPGHIAGLPDDKGAALRWSTSF